MVKINKNSIDAKEYIIGKVMDMAIEFNKLTDDESKKQLIENLKKTTSSDEYKQNLAIVNEDSKIIRDYTRRKKWEDLTPQEFKDAINEFYGQNMDLNLPETRKKVLNAYIKRIDKIFGDGTRLARNIIFTGSDYGYSEKICEDILGLLEKEKGFINSDWISNTLSFDSRFSFYTYLSVAEGEINNENLKGAFIVMMWPLCKDWEFIWIKAANAILERWNNAKIVLITSSYDILPSKDYSEKQYKAVEQLSSNPNIKVIKTKFPLMLMADDFNNLKFDNNSQNMALQECAPFISEIRHDVVEFWKEWFYKKENCEQAQKYYNSFKEKFWYILPNATFDEFVEFITKYDGKQEEKMPWQEISWVYCDIDGTLIIVDEKWEKMVNEKVLNYLIKCEKSWKEIHIRTWWDLSKQREVLEKFWITYPLSSKYDYSWAIAEIVIDDCDEDGFKKLTSITPKSFINVKNI